MANLIIENVDLKALEEQRQALNRTVDSDCISVADEALMKGLASMLDEWSDKIYRREKRLYLDYVNDFVTVEKFAEHYSLPIEEANRIIRRFRNGCNRKVYQSNLVKFHCRRG